MIVRNKEGTEHLGRCNITLACRGKLTQTDIFPSYQRGDITAPVEGLDDWYPREILYNHDQSIDSKDWIVQHKFGTDPAVIVFIDDPLGKTTEREEITPKDIEILSPDSLRISFERSYSGIAQLIARQSHPNLFNPIPDPEIEEETSQRITVSAQWTIGTRVSTVGISELIKIKVVYVSGSDDPYEVIYTVDDEPAHPSPWSDYDRVSIKGKIYTVRSFNFHHQEMIKNGKIKPGSYAYITSIAESVQPESDLPEEVNFRPLEQEEVVILLANEPYESVDKNRFKYVDAFDTIENTTSLFYNDSVMYCLPNIIKPVHPPIQKA
jgi:hypothetical protein